MSTPDLFDDDYDPLAPIAVSTSAEEEAEDVVDPLVELVPDGDDDVLLGEAGDGGFGGADGLVRIWFDDDGRLERVRVSPVWFKKLGPGQTLEQAFRQAFRASGYAVEEAEEPEPADYSGLDFGELPEFSQESVEAYVALLAEHQARWDEAIARAEAEPQPRRPPARGKSKGVVVVLDDNGHPAEVEFDDDWLDEAQVGSICNHVVAAAHKAYAKYVPRTNEHLTELERFRMEHDVLIAGFQALMQPRGN